MSIIFRVPSKKPKMVDGKDVFHLLGVLVLQKNLTMLSCVSLEVGPGPVPRLHYCFLVVPSLPLHPLPSLINNCSNLPFGTQGRSSRLESVPYKQETRDRKALMSRSPTGSCSVNSHIISYSYLVLKLCLNTL